ncbi:hypothetical protein IWW34DRAFT_754328 [Fusarium oxysporum f. sp. albedinis]|nr:hypothetical protein IWW34DRAFT_754328 [Fusarium oxysporum f. sp. albedinis]KAJ0128041.1 Uncharacterized protein HZ326_28861 [Fusarium oxysporum f. sp. albedinis]KAK2471391.1 hypothetical protein H9L39_17622 [Fusarium oxysporum f. sp. albedinis]
MFLPPLRQSQLLFYHSKYRVLLCKECRYAIQPSAISRHLKELHRIYRSDRQGLMEYAQSLDLADPAHVVLPKPHEAPVPFLPVESGLACGARDCGHLCVTVKRMKHHWAAVHSDLISTAPRWRPVDLQTFFRGNQLRYFIVSRSPTTSQPERNAAFDSEAPSVEIGMLGALLTHDPHWTADDLGLLLHFQNYTYLDLGYNSESRQLWRTSIPQLACSHSFLKHGILACSALHLAYLNPLERQRYQFTAARHQNRALPSFRSAIASANKNNYNALLAFSQLLIIHCLASEKQDENLLLVGGKHESGLPDWLHVMRGSCTIFGNVWQFMKNGPFTPLMVERMLWQRLTPVPENSEYARRLGLLTELPFLGKKISSQHVTEASLSPFSGALLALSRAFSKAQAARLRSVFTIWTALHMWPGQVSQDYLDLLKNRDPASLILLAHYCILLEPFESHWYMGGFRKRLLSRIYNQLDQEWRHWLNWPMEEVGLWE